MCELILSLLCVLSGRLYGADDFLPMLTYVLAQCDMPQLDNEILYMMELLDPSQLHGEGMGSRLRPHRPLTPTPPTLTPPLCLRVQVATT